MVAPVWVTKELFENGLREFLGDKTVEVLGYSNSAAVAAGDNYTSNIFRTCVTYRNVPGENKQSLSVIVKCTLDGTCQILELVRDIKMFEKEAEMYQRILPAIYNILGEYWTLSAKLIYYTKTPYKLIMFEDLSAQGFKMCARQQGLDLEHCLSIIDKMASFHAASLVLCEKVPSVTTNFERGLISDNNIITKWIQVGWDALSKACKNWPGFEKYSMKLKPLREKIASKTMAVASRKLGGFNVLNHGDSHVNNFMFSYTPEGKIKDLRYVDYQMVVYSSPAIDLHYFWTTSPRIEVRKEHLYLILDRYYGRLLATLTKLNYPLERVPTRKQFLHDFHSRAFYGFITSITVMPLIKSTDREDANFENILTGNDSKDSFLYYVYNNDRYRKHMEYLLPYFDDLGVFDYY